MATLSPAQQALLDAAAKRISDAQTAYDQAVRDDNGYEALVRDKERAYNYFLNLHDTQNSDIVRKELDAMRPQQAAYQQAVAFAKGAFDDANNAYESLRKKLIPDEQIKAEAQGELTKLNYAQKNTQYFIIGAIVLAIIGMVFFIKRKKARS